VYVDIICTKTVAVNFSDVDATYRPLLQYYCHCGCRGRRAIVKVYVVFGQDFFIKDTAERILL